MSKNQAQPANQTRPAQAPRQERRLGRTILNTYRDTVDLYDLVPNEKQPRGGSKEDIELQIQIEANEGIFEPLLVEPHPDLPGKFRIIDGDRRWTNSKVLVEEQKKDIYRRIPVEITEHPLSDEERLRVWIYIHRQRKEWDTKEKEMVAYNLVDYVGRASAANILGIKVRELDKLVDVFELAEKIKNLLPDPNSSITWSREIKSINKDLLKPTVLEKITSRIKNKEITNSKDIRKLRQILKDPIARDAFISDEPIEGIFQRFSLGTKGKDKSLASDIDVLNQTIRSYPWVTLAELRGDPQLLQKLDEAEKLLKDLKKALSK
jgi:ParB family chromosome partitioning protein